MTSSLSWRRPKSAVRRLWNQLAPGAVILLYHRVARVSDDPFSLAVAPEVFNEHLQLIRKYFQPCTLSKLAEGLRAGRMPRRAAVVTFDDGYADNLYAALPMLERHEVPATMFVTTGGAESGDFWWDRLTHIVSQAQSMDRGAGLALPDGSRWFPLGTTTEDRNRAFTELYAHLRRMEWRERSEIIGTIERQLIEGHGSAAEFREAALDADAVMRTGQSSPAQRMTPDELRLLAKSSLVEIGAHTVNHPVLSNLPVAEQRAEIDGSRRHLENIVGARVRSFAYPFGYRGSFDATTTRLVAEAGFECATTTIGGRVRRGSSLLELPRIQVFSWDAARFDGALAALAATG